MQWYDITNLELLSGCSVRENLNVLFFLCLFFICGGGGGLEGV